MDLPYEELCRRLGVPPKGNSVMARCPAHDDRVPSLSISISLEGKVLVHCHAGCNQATVIGVLRARGLWRDKVLHHPPGALGWNKSITTGRHDDAHRTRIALEIWRASKPATGTPVEAYLRARGLTMPLPRALRFHRGLKHPAGATWSAMIGLVTRGIDNLPLAIHRTFLERDGAGKAPVEPAKMMLGPCRGGAVRLSSSSDGLMIGEGIATCLAAMQATGRPAWAALSTSGLGALDLPDVISDVTVLADGDKPGEAAACRCARRWKRQGRTVRIARPPLGMDFNDVLLGSTPPIEEGAR